MTKILSKRFLEKYAVPVSYGVSQEQLTDINKRLKKLHDVADSFAQLVYFLEK